MLMQAVGEVAEHIRDGLGAQVLHVEVVGGQKRQALNYPALTGEAEIGDHVLLNTTAQQLRLGTGGYDLVMANFTRARAVPKRDASPLQSVPDTESSGRPENTGHIIKARYLPCQHAVLTLEEQAQYADVWERNLDDLPVLVGQLHSQIAPAAAALRLAGRERVAYVMTDGASLMLGFSRLVRQLTDAGLLHATLTCGQAAGGEWETVTLHSALLAARHIAGCDAIIVCQGPGNAGTGTKYGFSGIEQAQNIDIVRALGGQPIAIVRISEADARARHRGISHHTRTTLDLSYARSIVAVPVGVDISALPPGHDIREVSGTQAALDLLTERGIAVTSMGRTPAEDPLFFHAAAAAGLVIKEPVL